MAAAATRSSAIFLAAILISLGYPDSCHGQAFTMPGWSDLPALPGLASGFVNSITGGE
jgi:hypothetical protein